MSLLNIRWLYCLYILYLLLCLIYLYVCSEESGMLFHDYTSGRQLKTWTIVNIIPFLTTALDIWKLLYFHMNVQISSISLKKVIEI